jgi:hypothetical protein
MDKTEIIVYLNKLPIYILLENQNKFSSTYMSLCTLRNKLIESNFVKKEFRNNMYFFYKNNNNYIKIKEGEILKGTIYLDIKEEKDFSESSNILFYLEKRITEFEPIFKTLYEDIIFEYTYKKYQDLIKLWNNFKEYNDESFDYNNWYFIMKQDDISLLRKMSLDIKKWLRQKEKLVAEVDIIYLNTLEYNVKDEDFNFINNYLYLNN